MLLPRAAALLMMLMVVGCSSTRDRVRVATGAKGETIVYIPRTAGVQPVTVEEEEAYQAIRRLAREVPLTGTGREIADKTFQLAADSGNYLYLPEDKKLVPLGLGEPLEGSLTEEDMETAERYRVWCQQVHHSYGDCLGGALVGGRYLDMRGRYLWAMAMSKSPVLAELKKALGDMVEFRALFSAALWTGASMLMICALNPVAPGLVAVMGLGLVLYVGYAPLYNLVTGWFQLMEEVRYATTFEEIRAAGERFGKRIGVEAARVFAMLVMAAIGRTAQEFAATLPKLPGSAQVAVQAEAQAGIALPALAAVEEIVVTTEGLRFVLPPGAVAMAAVEPGGPGFAAKAAPPDFKAFKSMRAFKKEMGTAGEGKNWHHIVEQTPGNVERFGPEALHNTRNVTAIGTEIHLKISAYYSSKQKITGGMVVREWLRTKSYAEQREFGLKTLRRFGVIP
jgi:hypothetical protein